MTVIDRAIPVAENRRLGEIDTNGVIALARELMLPCSCQLGTPKPECEEHGLDRSWLLRSVLNDEQLAAYEHTQAQRGMQRGAA